MFEFFKSLPEGTLEQERIKGARLSIYFRWLFILLLSVTVSAQFFSGYREESFHSIRLIIIYFLSNLGLWYAVKRDYDPPFLGYISATLDIGIISFHLFYLAFRYDIVAVTAAATTFLYPIMFLLYTFRLNRYLLLYTIAIAIIGFNANYFFHLPGNREFLVSYLSLSPLSHLFKSAYILFIGLLCFYFQYSMSKFIEKQLSIVAEKAELGAKVKLEEQKNYHAQQLIEQEKLLSKRLEQEVSERSAELVAANTQLLNLQKENLQSQFDMLKQQVNPHFLFNSLNVLTSLIKIDPDLAETFTEKLSKVYRYVLENKEKDLVELDTEFDFIRAYLFLLDIRFMNKIVVDIRVPQQYANFRILPVAMQLVIENAIKHNTFSKGDPLRIDIFVDEDEQLNVVNNLNARESKFASTGVGIINITRRYGLITDKKPQFLKTDRQFVVKLPLLRPL